VIRTLQGASASFRIVKAHRDLDPTDFSQFSPADHVSLKPDFEHFKFDEHALNEFDQMWLLGIGGPGVGGLGDTNPLTENELIALARFMDGGGGVFATGDHADLGSPLCGRIPRVRSMRKWNLVSQNGEPTAPSAQGADRIDTTQPGHEGSASSPNFAFSNQSDDIPQRITATVAGQSHPLLKLNDGRTLSVLPDHMHEGEVIDPFDPQFHFSPTITFATGTASEQMFVEYPNGKNNLQVVPQILATGKVLGGHTTLSAENAHKSSQATIPTQARDFGVIGAYDGQWSWRGRVCVDSTWHHFFDINLIGDPVAMSSVVTVPPEVDGLKRKGFKATPQGQATLVDIKNYYRNIANWLARAPR